MKAKASEEEGGVDGGVDGGVEGGVRPALKSFLHQVISEQQDRQTVNGKRAVSAFSRFIDLPLKEPLREPPSLPIKPKTISKQHKNGVSNNKPHKDRPDVTTTSPKEALPESKSNTAHALRPAPAPPVVAVTKPDDLNKDAATAVDAAPTTTSAPGSTPAPSSTSAPGSIPATGTVNGTGKVKLPDVKRDDWWRDRVARAGARPGLGVGVPASPKAAPKTTLRRDAVVRKASDAEARSRRAASPARKPSFKVAAHRPGSKARHGIPSQLAAVKVTIASSRVQALATKFNSLETSSTPSLGQGPAAMPHHPLKRQPSDIKIIVGNRAGVIKSVPPAIMDEVVALSTKIHSLQDSKDHKDANKPKVALLRKRPSFAKTRGNKVKAAVRIFEPSVPPTTTPTAAPTPAPTAEPTPASTPASTPDPTPGPAPSAAPTATSNNNAISKVPKKKEPVYHEDLTHEDLHEWASSKRSKESPEAKTKRSQNKTLLKTAKTVLSEEKRLVVVNIDDIDAIPPLPSTPPPQADVSNPMKDILDKTADAASNTLRDTPPPSDPADTKPDVHEPPALPARNNQSPGPGPTPGPSPDHTPDTTPAPASTEEPLDAQKTRTSKLQANNSFLWRAAPMSEVPMLEAPMSEAPAPSITSPASQEADGPSFRAVPAMVQPEASDADPQDDTVSELYDDVVSPTAENIYDDIGVDKKETEMYETCGGGNYDDCEGEGYQFVDNATSSYAPPAPPPPLTAEEEEEAEDNIYDDVLSERKSSALPDDAVSTSGVYEAIYLVRPRGAPRGSGKFGEPLLPPGIPGSRRPGVGRHGSSCSSSSSSRSSSAGNASSYCGKINSLYGEPLTDEQAMAGETVTAQHKAEN